MTLAVDTDVKLTHSHTHFRHRPTVLQPAQHLVERERITSVIIEHKCCGISAAEKSIYKAGDNQVGWAFME